MTYYGLRATETVHFIKKIFKNYERHNRHRIFLGTGYIIHRMEANITNPDGSKREISRYDLLEEKIQIGSRTYGDYEKSIIYPNLTNGSVIETKYEIERYHGFYGSIWYLQDYRVPKIFAEYCYIVPEELIRYTNTRWKASLGELKENTEIIADTMSRFKKVTWRMKHVPSFKIENEMPPLSLLRAKIEFSGSNDWNEVMNQYYTENLDKQFSNDLELVKQTKELISADDDENSKINKLASFVKSNIRYEAIELGDKGLKPEKPEKVLSVKYGDCKDMSTLLVSMFRIIGINAYPVILLTSNSGYTDVSFPKWSFNHMIVFVKDSDGNERWIDPTCQFCNDYEIPHTYEGVVAFVIKDTSNFEMKNIPMSSYDDNVREYISM